jgi:Tol biopolymer transport system component
MSRPAPAPTVWIVGASERVRRAVVLLITSMTVVVGAATPAAAAPPPVTRVNVSAIGAQADDETYDVTLSETGQYVAFTSYASNFVPGRNFGTPDVFLKDLSTGDIDLVSVDNAGRRSPGPTGSPSISRDGRYVAFESRGLLAPEDSNGAQYTDVYVRDRTADTTRLVSLNRFGIGGNRESRHPAISANGRYVVFTSAADNLVDYDDNQRYDVFVSDLTTGDIVRVNVSAAGDEADWDSNAVTISPNGRYVAFSSAATNLVPGDTNNDQDIFLVQRPFDPTLRSIERVSLDSAGGELDGTSAVASLSANGRYVAFYTEADLVQFTHSVWNVAVRDRTLGTTTVLSTQHNAPDHTGNGDSREAQISPDGGYVTFSSAASDLIADDTNGVSDVFVWTRSTGAVTRVSRPSSGEANGMSEYPAINDGGTRIAFRSVANNLVPGDINGRADMFVTGTGVVGAQPSPPVTATLACEQGPSTVLCTFTYSGGTLGPPQIRWYVNGMHQPGLAGQTFLSRACTVGSTVRVRVVVTEAAVPTFDQQRTRTCIAVPL